MHIHLNTFIATICMHAAAEARGMAEFGAGPSSQPIYLDEVSCGGSEMNLSECASRALHDCEHSEDAGVICRGKDGRGMFQCTVCNY